MQVAILKYNAGNIRSVVNALRLIGCEPLITDSAEQLQTADRVVIPEQGAAGATMKYLRENSLDKIVTNLRQPVLGICIGQQLMCSHSEEDDTDCLGISLKLIEWAKEAADRGAGEILFTSMNNDCVKHGFANETLAMLAASLSIPVVASGGTGNMYTSMMRLLLAGLTQHWLQVLFHFGEITIPTLKEYLADRDVKVRR